MLPTKYFLVDLDLGFIVINVSEFVVFRNSYDFERYR